MSAKEAKSSAEDFCPMLQVYGVFLHNNNDCKESLNEWNWIKEHLFT